MMAGTRKLEIIISGDAKGALDALNKTGKSAETTGGKVEGSGKKAGLALAAVGVGAAAMAKGWIDAATESAKVTKQTEAVIKSMGNASNITADQVGELAGQLALKTGVDDELIQSGQNLLLTFGNVRNEVGKGNDIFTQATKAALDMSVAMGTDMTGASIQVGKALNDPIKGVNALAKAGVSFTQQQKDQIRTMVESGDTMGAQKIILSELTKQFEGSAEAQATAGAKLAVVFGNLQEEIGAALLPVVEDLAGGAQFLLESFDKLPEQTQGVITKMIAFGTVGLGAAASIAFVVDKVGSMAETLGNILPALTNATGGLTALGKVGLYAGSALAVFAGVQIARSFNETTVSIDQMAAALEDLDEKSQKQLANQIRQIDSFGKLDGVITKAAEQNATVAQQFLDQAEAAGVNSDEIERLQKIIDDKGKADVTGKLKADEHAAAMEREANAAAIAAGDLKALGDELRAQFDPLFAAQSAQQSLTDAQTKATEAIRAHGAASAEARAANDAAVQAALRFQGSMLSLKDAVDKGDVSLDTAVGTLQAWARQGLITKAQADQTTRSFGALDTKARGMDPEVVITVKTPVLLAAIANFEKLQKFQGATTVTKAAAATKQAATVAGQRAAGGPVSRGLAYLVGEDGPELFVPGATGQIIPNGGPARPERASVAGQSQPMTLVLQIDGRTFAQLVIDNVLELGDEQGIRYLGGR